MAAAWLVYNQCSTFCFEKSCTDTVLSIAMPTFFCGVLTKKWFFFFLIKKKQTHKTKHWSEVLSERKLTEQFRSRILNFLYLYSSDIICHQLRVYVTDLIPPMLPKPRRFSLFSASIHKQSPISLSCATTHSRSFSEYFCMALGDEFMQQMLQRILRQV